MAVNSSTNHEIVAAVLVGSRLHGLQDTDSDWDMRQVIVSPLLDIISPFRNQKTRGNGTEEDDTVRFELTHFVKHLVQGNATMLEILWSPLATVDSDAWLRLTSNRSKVLDTTRVYDAHKGYASNQKGRFRSEEGDDEAANRRRGKFVAACIRTLVQGIDLLKTGDFNPVVCDRPDLGMPTLVSALRHLRQGLPYYEAGHYEHQIDVLRAKLDGAYGSTKKRTPDIRWLDCYLYDAYTEGIQR